MDKLIPTLAKQLSQHHSHIATKFLSSPLPYSSLNTIHKEIEKRVLKMPATNFLTFCDNIFFENYLNSIIPLSLRKNIIYHLNSKVLPSLLPSDCKVSVWSPALFSPATKLTHPENIIFSNPYKTFEGLIDARKFGVTNMVINSLEEIHKILCQPEADISQQMYRFIWEFQEIDFRECKSVLKDLIRRKIKLAGVRFKLGYRDQLQEMEKIIQVGCKFGHDLSHNSYQICIEDVKNIQNSSKNSQKLEPLIMNLDTSPFVLCASRVFGKNKRTTVHSQSTQSFINGSTILGAVQVNGREWTLFNPTQCLGLQEASNDLIRHRLMQE